MKVFGYWSVTVCGVCLDIGVVYIFTVELVIRSCTVLEYKLGQFLTDN